MSKRILVVDDEEFVRSTEAFILVEAGFEVSMAKNGEDALKSILKSQKENEPFDLLLTDHHMPVMNGLELIKLLSQLKISLPVIVITGMPDNNLLQTLSLYGCNNILIKPFHFKDLTQRVRTLLEKKKYPKTFISNSELLDRQII